MKYGVPLNKIAATTLGLVALLIVTGAALLVAHHDIQGTALINLGMGVVVGSGATTGIVIQNAKNKTNSGGDGEQ